MVTLKLRILTHINIIYLVQFTSCLAFEIFLGPDICETEVVPPWTLQLLLRVMVPSGTEIF